jgi:ParB family chromosome partitioning protein
LGETARSQRSVIVASDEDAFIMSLAENIARRQWRPLELLAVHRATAGCPGYTAKQIATKTGLAFKSTCRAS